MAPRRAMGEVSPRLIATAPETQPVVKSARRVLEILEFFADYRRPATSIEVAEGLKYPQSSTAALLKSLVALGYLYHDPVARTYISTGRVALLGPWIDPRLSTPGPILQLMQRLNAEVGEAIILGVRCGLHVQYVYVVQSPDPNARQIGISHFRPLATSAVGQCFLSAMPDAKVMSLIRRINAEATPGETVHSGELLERLAQIRHDGHAVVYSKQINCGAMAACLPAWPGRESYVIGISADREVMRARSPEFAKILCQATESQRQATLVFRDVRVREQRVAS